MVVLSEYAEGSSSSTNHHKYDVFLSFRGVDTRHSFTDHLHKALLGANISTFLDDEEIVTGGELKPELESAIKESRASIIVLSKNYADSSWCLDELALIIGEHMTSNQIVIPIFYHVEPTDVRKQQSSFGDAMAKHKQVMKTETNANKRRQWAQKIDRWIQALTKVADLKGMSVDGRRETKFIEEIVKDVYHRLRISSRIPLPQLIGMVDSKNFITSWLKDTSLHTANILTILGMGGIGKTSLSKYIYGLHSHEFETSSFIEDISRRCEEKYNGLLDLQKQLHDDISKESSLLHDVFIYTSKIENVMSCKKVFLVLDDIDSLDQLDALLGRKGFHPESKILITTKDARLTESCALFKADIKPRHAMHLLQGLFKVESQQLLCYNAFMSNAPKAGFKEVSEKLVNYCQGHPLALKVLGKSLYNRDVVYWEEYMEELKKESGSPVNNVLRKSFDSLPSKNDKDLFKHISCFFVGMDMDYTQTILKACDIKTRSGIMNLIDKCLLSIGRNNELKMHQLIQEMGKYIVRQESPEKPWKRSRLWCHMESFKVLKQKKGKGYLLGLALDMRMLEKEKFHGSFELKTNAFSMMDNLMLLQLNYVQIDGSYENFSKEIRWLCMHGFPSKCLPADLPMDNLVALDMSYSNIESFVSFYPQTAESRKKKLLGSLKILNLSFCERLRSLVGFVELPALERLIATNCNELLEVCESVEQCVELVYIDLSYCNKLKKLSMGMLKKVKVLLLEGCNFGESRIEIGGIDSPEMVKANNIGINTNVSSSVVLEAIPSDLKFFRISLPSSLVELSLEDSNLSTESFPMDFSCLSMLEALYLDRNPISFMPDCVRSLPRIQTLSMTHCESLTSVEHPPSTLTRLNVFSEIWNLLRKVVFDPEMRPLDLCIQWRSLAPPTCVIEGVVKIQLIEDVEVNVLHSLGWNMVDFFNKKGVLTYSNGKHSEEHRIQMYYEFGIFSTIYGGTDMPNWMWRRSSGTSISFTIPSSPKKIRGINFCYVNRNGGLVITVHNITKNSTWMYEHCIKSPIVGALLLTMLSHWMFRNNEMEGGDQVTIYLRDMRSSTLLGKECGVSVVYDDGNTDEEDALGYYKSWNHIIGGDLSAFQITTGEYMLTINQIVTGGILVDTRYRELVPHGTRYKERIMRFRALSQRKPAILGHVHEEIGTSTRNALILNDEDENDVEEGEAEAEVEAQGEAKDEVEAEDENDVEEGEAEAKVEVQAQAKDEVEAEDEAQTQGEAKDEVEAEDENDVEEAEAKVEAEVQAKDEVEAEDEAEAEAKVQHQATSSCMWRKWFNCTRA